MSTRSGQAHALGNAVLAKFHFGGAGRGRSTASGKSAFPSRTWERVGRPPWFKPRVVLGEAGLEDSAAGRRNSAPRMRERAMEELSGKVESPDLAEVRRGWCMGGEGFRERMLGLLDVAGEKLGRHRTSSMEAGAQRDHGMAGARRLLEAGLRCVGLEAGQLAGLPKGDARKAALAAMIRIHTAVSNAWIAKELELGHVGRVSHCVRNAPADLLAKLEKCR